MGLEQESIHFAFLTAPPFVSAMSGKTLVSSHDASTLNRALRCRYKFQSINSDLRRPSHQRHDISKAGMAIQPGDC
jgi:hypothetical protein